MLPSRRFAFLSFHALLNQGTVLNRGTTVVLLLPHATGSVN